MKHIVYIELMFNIVYNKAARKKSKRRKTPTKNPLWVVKYIEISKFIFLAIVVARFLPCINYGREKHPFTHGEFSLVWLSLKSYSNFSCKFG